MREYPLQYAGTDRIKKSHYNSPNSHCLHLIVITLCLRITLDIKGSRKALDWIKSWITDKLYHKYQ